jgi:hypothetical protein
MELKSYIRRYQEKNSLLEDTNIATSASDQKRTRTPPINLTAIKGVSKQLTSSIAPRPLPSECRLLQL